MLALALVDLLLDVLGDILLGDLAPLEGSREPRLVVFALLGGDLGASLRRPFLQAHAPAWRRGAGLRRGALLRRRHGDVVIMLVYGGHNHPHNAIHDHGDPRLAAAVVPRNSSGSMHYDDYFPTKKIPIGPTKSTF